MLPPKLDKWIRKISENIFEWPFTASAREEVFESQQLFDDEISKLAMTSTNFNNVDWMPMVHMQALFFIIVIIITFVIYILHIIITQLYITTRKYTARTT